MEALLELEGYGVTRYAADSLTLHAPTSEIQLSGNALVELGTFLAILIGTIAGGRLGYMFFYGFDQILANPLNVLKVWEGGMSFHGGLLGVLLAQAVPDRLVGPLHRGHSPRPARLAR